MNINRHSLIALLFGACCVNVGAGHKDNAPWSWHIRSAGSDESRIAIYRGDKPLGNFDISCDLTDVREGPQVENGASLNRVQIDSHPDGLLLITCNVGAHSQMISIIDLASKANEPVFSVTGSFFAKWELQDGALWISYDRPCEAGLSVECPDGFETIFLQYSEPAQGQ